MDVGPAGVRAEEAGRGGRGPGLPPRGTAALRLTVVSGAPGGPTQEARRRSASEVEEPAQGSSSLRLSAPPLPLTFPVALCALPFCFLWSAGECCFCLPIKDTILWLLGRRTKSVEEDCTADFVRLLRSQSQPCSFELMVLYLCILGSILENYSRSYKHRKYGDTWSL